MVFIWYNGTGSYLGLPRRRHRRRSSIHEDSDEKKEVPARLILSASSIFSVLESPATRSMMFFRGW